MGTVNVYFVGFIEYISCIANVDCRCDSELEQQYYCIVKKQKIPDVTDSYSLNQFSVWFTIFSLLAFSVHLWVLLN